MKMTLSSFVAVIISAASLTSAAPKPNVVIIYGDDVGFGDVGAYGAKMIPTPNIDKLASESMRFTDGHCSASTCTPSRFSMLTGRYGFRHNARVLPPNAPLTIPTDIMTLPKMFKRAGYTTAVVGKWHLGIGEKGTPVDWNGDVKPGPLEVGFDYSFLLPSTNDRVPCVYVENHRVVDLDPNDPLYVGMNPKDVNKPGSTVYPDGRRNREAMTFYQSTHGHDHSVINGIGRIGYMAGGKSALWDDSTMSDRFVDEAKQYIAKHKSEPFFLYFASQAIHVPRAPHPRFRGRTKLGYRGDSMVEFDWCVGELMQTLEKHGLKENTIVIFSSDNGPVYDDGYDDGTTVMCSSEESDGGHDGSGLHRGGKYQIFEGGTRVPFIIRWPARIKPGVSDAMVSQIDFTASFAELVGVELKSGEASDSRSTLKAFLGEDKDGLDFLLEESFGLALRQGDWKYMTAARPQWPPKRPAVEPSLYNLKDDPGETKNVIADHPEIAERLAKKIEEIKKGAEAR